MKKILKLHLKIKELQFLNINWKEYLINFIEQMNQDKQIMVEQD